MTLNDGQDLDKEIGCPDTIRRRVQPRQQDIQRDPAGLLCFGCRTLQYIARGADRDCFQVLANDVIIQGFKIQNAISQPWLDGWQNAGIMVGDDGVHTLMIGLVEQSEQTMALSPTTLSTTAGTASTSMRATDARAAWA